MANPATAFSQRERDSFPYDPTAGQPANGETTPTGLNGISAGPRGALTDMAINTIMQSIKSEPPKSGFGDFLRGSPKQNAYEQGQDKGQLAMQALNSMTGMENSQWRADTSARGWALINARLQGLDQSGQRIDLAQRRFQWQQLGLQEDYKTEFDPVSGTNRNVIYAIQRDPATGKVVLRDKVTLDQMPVGLGMYEGPGGHPVQFPTSPMGNGTVPPQHSGGASAPMGAPAGAPNNTQAAQNAWNGTAYNAQSAGGPPVAGGPPAGNTPKPLGGPLAPKQPPPGPATAFQANLSFLNSIDRNTILGLHSFARKSAASGNFSFMGPFKYAAADWMAQGDYRRGMVGDPEVQYTQAIKWAVYQYVKAQTGAQFSVTEMDRYALQFPNLNDDEGRAGMMIDSAIAQAMFKVRAAQAQWGGLRQPGYTPEVQAAEDQVPPMFKLMGGQGSDRAHTNSKLPPGSQDIPPFIAAADDGNKAETQYGDWTTNIGNPKIDLDAAFDEYMRNRNAPKR